MLGEVAVLRGLRESRPMIRTLRTVGFAFCLLLCIGFVILWGRSYSLYDVLNAKPAGCGIFANSWRGQLEMSSGHSITQWSWSTLTAEEHRAMIVSFQKSPFIAAARGLPVERRPRGFSAHAIPGGRMVTAPHWFPVLITGILAVVLKVKPRWRFSLREMFVLV